MTDARTFLYWLKAHRSSSSCSLDQIKYLLENPDLNVKIDVSTFDLRYIYLFKDNADENNRRLTALFSDESKYYVLDNESLWSHESPEELVAGLPEDLRKYLDIKTPTQIAANLSKVDKQALAGVLPMDFARATHEEQIDLWKRYIEQKQGDTLDLSGLYNLNPRVIIEAGNRYEKFTTLILNQNSGLCQKGFSWLFYFPKLQTFSAWYVDDMTEESLVNFHKYAPNVKITEFHQCKNLSGRCLIHLTDLEKIIIDNEMCRLQDTTYETVITDDEWKGIKSDTLNTLFINSANLTLDFIDLCLKSFTSLTNFVMNELVLQKLDKHSRSGHTERKISFHSSADINQGFYRYADVKITDLVRNKIAPAFSEAMLRKIRELDPCRAELIDQMLK